MRHITSQIRIYERDSRDEHLPVDHDETREHRKENEEDFYFQVLVVYRNLDIINQATIRRVPIIIRYGGIVFELGFLAIRVRSMNESSNMRSASSESATDVSLVSSRIELTLLVSDSL